MLLMTKDKEIAPSATIKQCVWEYEAVYQFVFEFMIMCFVRRALWTLSHHDSLLPSKKISRTYFMS